METPSFRNDQAKSEGQGGLLDENKSVSNDQTQETASQDKTARQKKAFNQTALTVGTSLGAVLGAAIGFFVPYVIILFLSTFGGDPSFSIFALIVGVICGVGGLFMGAAAGYLMARNSAGHFFKGKERKA